MRCAECMTCEWYTWFRMSVVRGMREVGGVCAMCMCLARGGVGERG